MANEKSTTCSRFFKPDQSFRSFVNVFMAMCLIACIISQASVCVYIHHKFTRMDERIDNLGNIVEKIVVERSSKSHTNQTALDENNVVRERRSVQQRATNLQSLAKRVIVIEKRWADQKRHPGRLMSFRRLSEWGWNNALRLFSWKIRTVSLKILLKTKDEEVSPLSIFLIIFFSSLDYKNTTELPLKGGCQGIL